ncbi:tyrosine-type recombinase/integrase [Gorillibacterium sp. sgz5001074]|uniref:site-specific integrase n=1 Tax=Gorillibacterium sp. sgz5001074 TaxID=3446695 RepID=UPI003F6820C1
MPYFRQRGDKWSFTINAGKDPITGKRKQIVRSGFNTEKEAQKAAAKIERDLEAGKRADSPTLIEFATQYFETQVKSQVTDSTYWNQWHYMSEFVFPVLGKLKLDKITYLHVEKFYSSLIERGIKRGTIKNISLVLNKTFKTAQKWQYIINNVMDHVKTPTYKPAKMKVWNTDEVKRFVEGTQGTKYHIAFVIALSTGMRLGEILGLHWDDIDWERKQLTITRSLKYDMVNRLHTKDTKNDHSQRTITLPDATVAALLEHRSQQLPGLHMVVNFADKYALPSEVSREFQMQVKRLKMTMIRFHDMRHTHATMLLQMGVNVKVVAERLGHSNVTTTLNTYAHVLPSMQKEVADKLNDVF